MENQVYCDEVGAIAVNGPVVKLDLMVYPTTDESGEKPKLAHHQRVVIPLDGFLRAAARMQQVVQDLEKKGIIKRGTRETKGTAAD